VPSDLSGVAEGIYKEKEKGRNKVEADTDLGVADSINTPRKCITKRKSFFSTS
jgi:hypothetical protein